MAMVREPLSKQPADLADAADRERTLAIITRLSRPRPRCPQCANEVSRQEHLLAYALGFGDDPPCLADLARQVDQPAMSLLDAALGHVAQRGCLREAWIWAAARDGLAAETLWRPEQLVEQAQIADASVGHSLASGTTGSAVTPSVATVWQAGELSCGDLVLELRLRLRALHPGDVIEVHSHDIAAPEDLPAWCRMTGHTLLYQSHPVYRIQRKRE